MLKKFSKCCDCWKGCLEKLSWLPALITRLSVGVVFAEAGWGKFQHIPKVIEFFRGLGIPAPQIQAPFVAGVELVGGVMLILGLFTRVITIPLSCTMVVAIITAKREDMENFTDLFAFSEYLYIVLFLWLLVFGAGKISLDQLFKNKCKSE